MPVPTLNSISPSSGPPGTAITVLGSGFDTGAQVGCPVLVPTTRVSVTELHAAIPADLVGPAGGSFSVVVYAQNEDGSQSPAQAFRVLFPRSENILQAFTSVEAVAAEVPGFKRGGTISDATIGQWIRSIAQSITGVMMRRGYSLNPSAWQQPDSATAMPAPAGVLELINRYGAASRLAAAIAGQFSTGEWGLAKTLQTDYVREFKALSEGQYDKLFRPSSATIETDQQVSVGDIVTDDGAAEQAFTKDQVF